MATTTGIGFDLSEALAQAGKLDSYIDKWAKQSEIISNNMSNAMSSKANNNLQGYFDSLKKMQDALNQLSKTNFSPNVDTSKIDDLTYKFLKVIDVISTMKNTPLFNPQEIYDTNKGLGETSDKFNKISANIKNLVSEWATLSKFETPVNSKTGEVYGKGTTVYEQSAKRYRDDIEKQLQAEIEKEAIAKKELDWTKKTQAEKAAYIQKSMDEMLKSEQRYIANIRKEYSSLLADLSKVDARKKQYSEASGVASTAGISVPQETQTVYQEVLRQEQNLVERKKEIEAQYWTEVTDIAERHVLQQSQIEIEEFKRKAAEKKKMDDAQWESYLKTAEGAVALSNDAKSINEEKTAIQYLIQARNNLSKTSGDYMATVEELNSRIRKHRISVEELTKAEQNENSLQPKIRNEYAQLLKESDKIIAAREKLSKTQAYLSGDPEAQKNMEALSARYEDITKRKIEIENAAQGKLDEVVREHEAMRAQQSIAAIEKLEADRKRIQEEYNKKYGAISSTDALSVIGTSKSTENVRQAEKAIQDLKEVRSKLNKEDANYQDTLVKINKEIERQEKNIDRVVNAEKRRAQAQKLLEQRKQSQLETKDGAMEYSKQARTIEELNKAIKNLETARKKEDLTTKQGRKNYKELTTELSRQQKQYNQLTNKMATSSRSLLNTTDQLKRAFGLIFSVSQIKGYLSDIVNVRGEFEMQHRSLQVLLQDQDKANQIWEKTVALAIKSPFRIKELVTYTKQLAAYRVEADKLYDTTRMLADVSAGLGVDMNRLILAYGQVKAANYLRGTELRQFSEAGVNMLQELAERFTQIEGRVISVGDVFERVSKRMVSFEDVDAVFRKITSEGGIFYQMQEKQAETLKGIIMNLQDSLDVMRNDIGMSTNGILKSFLATTKNIIDNWRKLAPLVVAALSGMSVSVAIKGLKSIVGLLGSCVNAIKAIIKGGGALVSSSPWAALATALAVVVGYIIAARKSVSEFDAAMNNVEKNISSQLSESVNTYKTLAEKVNDVTKSEKERAKALSTLQSKFADILPQQYTEAEYVRQLGTNYKEANDAMLAYYDAKAREQKRSKINDLYADDEAKATSGLQNELASIISKSGLEEKTRTILLSYSKGIIANLVEDVKNGTIEIADFETSLIDRLATFANVNAQEIRNIFIPALSNFNVNKIVSLEKVLKKIKDAYAGITGMQYATYDEMIASEWIVEEKKQIEELTQAYSGLISEVKEYASMSSEEREKVAKTVDGIDSTKGAVKLADIQKDYDAFIAKFPEYSDLFKNNIAEILSIAENGSFNFMTNIQTLQSDFYAGLIPIINTAAEQAGILGNKASQDLVTNFAEGIKDSANKLNVSDIQSAIINVITEVSEKSEIAIDNFTKYVPKASESISEVRGRVSADIKGIEEDLKRWNASVASGIDVANRNRPKYLYLNPEDIEFTEKRLEALKLLAAALGEEQTKATGTQKDTSLDKLKRIIEVIKAMNREFEKLNKTFGSSKSRADVLSAYSETLKELGLDASKIDFTTKRGTANALYALLGDPQYAADKYVVEIRKAFSLLASEINLSEGELFNQTLFDRIQGMFDKYNLATELKKMGFSQELMKELFNVDYLDLDALRQNMINEFAAGAGKGKNKLVSELQKGFNNIDWGIVQSILGEDQMNEIRKRLQEIANFSDAEYKENAKKYLEYAKAAIGERAKIKLEELKKLKEIEETFKIREDDSQETITAKNGLKADAIANIKKEAQIAMDKLDWEEFQKSDMFVNLFKDLNSASTVLLDNMAEKLRAFKEQWKDMPLEDVKRIVDKINELEQQLAQRSPWQAYDSAKAKAISAMGSTVFGSTDAGALASKGGLKNFFDALEVENAYQEDKITNANKEATILETVLRVKQNIATEEEKILVNSGEYSSYLEMDVDTLNAKLRTQRKIKDDAQQEVADNQATLALRQQMLIALNAQEEILSKSAGMANDLFGAFTDLANVIDKDSPAMVFADMGKQITSAIPQVISLVTQIQKATIAADGMGVAMNMALGVVGLIVLAVELVAKAIAAVIDYTNQVKENKIAVIVQQVENLQKAYDKLSQSIDDVETSSGLDVQKAKLTSLYNEMVKTQKAKIALMGDDKDVRAGLAAEKKLSQGLKLTNNERKALLNDTYKEYKDAIDALQEMTENYYDNMDEIFSKATDGILDNAFDVARSFTDAWHDAFLETGEGLSGLEDSFEDMFKNLVRQQASLQITSLFTEKWKDELLKLTEGGNTLSPEVMQKWADKIKETLPELSSLLEAFFGGFKFGSGDSGLSGLQKGIQGITEATAEIIAAYLNSIRQYIATQNEQINSIATRLGVANDENPILSQLRVIATQATEINTLLNRLTKSGHSQGGVGLKVFMD